MGKYLDKDTELKEFSIRQADEVQALLLGNSDVMNGEASVNITDFKASMYLAIEYGTTNKEITRDYIQDLPASKADEVQELYDDVMKINGQ